MIIVSKIFHGEFGILLRHGKRIEGILPELLVSTQHERRKSGFMDMKLGAIACLGHSFQSIWSCCKVHEIRKVGMRWLVSTSVSSVMDVL